MMLLVPVRGYTRNGKAVAPHVRLVKNAVQFARDRHAGQTRADGVTPYILHPEAVINVLRRHGESDPNVLAAAALHDVLEDTPTREEEIRQRFGDDVADLVVELTDNPNLKGAAKKQDTLERILRARPGAQKVKLADKISNLRDALTSPPGDWGAPGLKLYSDSAERLAEGLLRVHPELAHELLELVQRARKKLAGESLPP